jgi:GntR family transcriptional regulator
MAPLYHFSMTIDKRSNDSSPIGFRLDPGSGVPTYLQLVHQVEQSLRLGYITQGDRLPTVKEAVGSLAINPNTVLKAYRELEHRGLAAGRPGQGTFIAGTLPIVSLAKQDALRENLMVWLREADEAGMDGDSISALFTTSLQDFLECRSGQGRRRGTARSRARNRRGDEAGKVA